MPSLLIIGAKGNMGRWCTAFFRGQGYDVRGIDKEHWSHIHSYLRECDIVLVSVPLHLSASVLKTVAGKMRKDQLLVDISSLKEPQAKALAKAPCETLLLHPLFGPEVSSPQNMAVCGNVGPNGKRFISILAQDGAQFVYLSPKEHDKSMALVQALIHLESMALGSLLRRKKIPSALLTPKASVLFQYVEKIHAQDAELYGAIILDNPYTKTALRSYISTLKTLTASKAKFHKEFSATKRALGKPATDKNPPHPLVVHKLSAVASDKRGETYEWCKSIPGMQVTMYTRNVGETFACHFHKGDDHSKSPERFLIIDGSMEIRWRCLDGRKGQVRVSAVSEVLISPWVYHEFVALAPCRFLEYRATVFDSTRSDSYPLAEFRKGKR